MKMVVLAVAAMGLASPAGAQTYSKQAAPRSLPALRAMPKPTFVLPPKLTAVQRNVAVKALTGNPAATASAEPVDFSLNMDYSNAGLELNKVDRIILGGIFAMMQPGGSVTMGLPGYGAKTPQGVWLFDCVTSASSLVWSGSVKGSYGASRIGGTVPSPATHAVFAVDLNLIDGAYVQIETTDKVNWIFGYCSATPVK